MNVLVQSIGKTYFISDVHLGASALKNNQEREKAFVRLLDEMKNDAAALYLVGDIFDFWYEYREVVSRGFTRTLGKIAEMTDSGISVHFFTGNHDVWAFDYLPKELGVTVHREPLLTEINGKKFFIAHGDGLDLSDKAYLRLKRFFNSKTAQWWFSKLHPNFAYWLGHKWSKHSRSVNGLIAAEYQGDDKESMYIFAANLEKTEHFDYYIFGHRHVLVERPIGEKSVYINLGDWIHHFSYGVYDGEKFELKQYKIHL